MCVHSANIATWSCGRSKGNAAAAEGAAAAVRVGWLHRGAGWAAAGGQGRAAPLGHHTWENLHELASNENMHKIMICKYIDCICRICKKICSENMQKYAFLMQNMQKSIHCIFCIYMHSTMS